MADDKKKIIEDLNEKVTDLGDNLTNLITSLGNQLDTALKNKLRGLETDAKNFIDQFEKGQDITKQLSQKINTIQKEANKLSDERLTLETELSKAQLLSNRRQSYARQQQILDQLLSNKLATKQLELTQDLYLNLQRAAEAEKQITEEKKKQNSLSIIANKIYDDNFKKIVQSFTTLQGIIDILIKAATNFNKISVDIGKGFGYGADQADRLTSSLVSAAQSSENVNFTLKNAAEAMSQLNEQTGFVAEYSAKTLETQIMLTKQFGLTAEEAAGIYKFSVLTGKSAEQVNKSMVGAYVAARNQLGVGIPFRATMAEAAKVSGQLAANLKNNPEFIVKAVAQAKALGTTLEQTKKQGESLLEFESSLEAELKAELLTGQALNLERARAAALMGDQVTVMKELNSQGMTFEKFQTMNVLAQRSFAAALGLSADELANQLRLQKLAVESGKSLAQITEEEALEAQKRQDIQSKFNAAIEKLQDLLGNLVAGPLGKFLEILTNIVSNTVVLSGLIGGALFINVLKLIKAFRSLTIASIIDNAMKTFSGIPLAGFALATAAAAGGIAYLNSKTADDMVSEGGYGKRTLLAPEGAIKLNDKDTIIAGTNLGKSNPQPQQTDNSALIAAINRQTDVISSKNYNPTLQTVIGGSVIATATTQNSYNLA
jgi:hypothetical protein